MDIGDIIKDYFWVILALLFYLLAGRKKTKKEGQTVPEAGRREDLQGTARPGLQDRLEQALRQMQAQADGTNRSAQSSTQSSTPSTVRQEAKISAPEEAVGLEPLMRETPFEFHSTVPLHQRKTVLESIAAAAPDSRQSTEFREGHGLHYHTHAAEMAGAGKAEFREAHGIRFGQGKAVRSAQAGSEVAAEDLSSFFRDEDELRRGVIAAEILGPPRSRRPV